MHNYESPTLGNNIMIAGLSTQVATLLLFILLALDFAVRTTRQVRALGAQNALDPHHARLRDSKLFWGFLVALFLATLLIFTRCVFRVAELSGGWTGALMKKEGLLIGFEGVVIVLSVYLLNFFHPGFCVKESVAEVGSSTAETSASTSKTRYGKKKNASQGSSTEDVKA